MVRNSMSARARHAFIQAADACGDLVFGVRTRRYHPAEELGHQSAECYHYAAVPYLALRSILGAIPNEVERATFVDYGCGLGRVLVAARRAGFRRAIGVELAESLVIAGRANMRRHTGWEIVHSDAADYVVPDDATAFFFGNPFGGTHLTKALQQIERSLQRRPRPHLILGYYNVDKMGIIADDAGLALHKVVNGTFAPAGKTWAGWVFETPARSRAVTARSA